MTESKKQILELVKQIPKGRVVSYGQIAAYLNLNPRMVGFIMSGLNAKETEEYPWQRVVNRNGYISAIKLGERGRVQEALLKAEGLEVDDCQIIEPERYWYTFQIGSKDLKAKI